MLQYTFSIKYSTKVNGLFIVRWDWRQLLNMELREGSLKLTNYQILVWFSQRLKKPLIYHQQPTGSVHGGLNNIPQQDMMHYFVIFRVTNTNGVVDCGRYDKVIQMSINCIFKGTGTSQNPGQKQICGTLSGTCAIFRLVAANDL